MYVNAELANDTYQRDAFGFYRTWWDEIRDLIESGEQQTAIELVAAICDYALDGNEYTGENGEVRRSLMQKIYVINKQTERRAAASLGGQKNCKVTQQKIVETLLLGNFGSQAAVARELGISPQALSKRLVNMGISIGDKARIVELYPQYVPEEYFERND